MRLCGTFDVGKKLESGVDADEPPKLGARQDLTCLLEEHRAHDHPELSGQSQPDQSTRHTTGADRSRHDDVGVDDDPEHLRRRPAGSLGSGSPQLGYRQLHRLVVIEGNSCRYLSVSDLVEHAHAAKPEVAAQSFFDDLVLWATVLASGSTECVEDALVDLYSGRAPCHVGKRTSDAHGVSAGLRSRRPWTPTCDGDTPERARAEDAELSGRQYVVEVDPGSRQVLYGVSVFAHRSGVDVAVVVDRFTGAPSYLEVAVGDLRVAGFAVQTVLSRSRNIADVVPGSAIIMGSAIGTYMAKVVAWDFEASDDDPMVVLDLVPLTPQAVERALARTLTSAA